MNTTAALALPALLVIALAGCGDDGSDGGDGDGGSGGSGGAGGSTASCLVGKTWSLDVADAAEQLGTYMTGNGLNVTESSGDGAETFTFNDDGTASTTTTLSYTITIDSGDGLVLTLVQTHTGTPSGGYEIDGDTVTFSDWNQNDYAIANHMMVNGVESDAPIQVPDAGLGGTDMVVSCDGGAMTTKVAASPFTQKWTS